MKKIILIGMVLLFAILVYGTISINLTPVVLEPISNGTAIQPEHITFDCDGNSRTINAYEPDGKWDSNDLESAIRVNCTGMVENIIMNGKVYRTNKYGKTSFDEHELKADECSRGGNMWNSTLKNCKKPIIDIESIVESNLHYCSTNPTREETCVCLSGTKRTCYYETCGKSPWGVCQLGEWVKI